MNPDVKLMLHIPRTGGSFIFKKFGVTQTDDVNIAYHHSLCHSFEKSTGFSNDIFNLVDYVDFVVFRNPYSWLYSYYTHKTNQHPHGWLNIKKTHNIESFEEFVNFYTDMSSQWPHPYRDNGGYISACYNDDGKFVPKTIIFLERLEEVAEEYFGEPTGIHPGLSINKPSKEYLEHYNNDMIKRVSKHFEKFNDDYGYTIDSGPREKMITNEDNIS